ncbi:ATP-binding cassette domain-containing protein [Aneurinibacillus danicus]|jgi:molybdate transport system ATP-binding protein|uniref:ABC transporter n=1 Tax=Aneurinibacillus danicus TaxID=267746 RepID=A0A511VAH9_9BACL|nr:ATP-binding cassette domain-containing protein [Aneurinibacillus danicus]GEN35874.1 ABC transporter [Aneurinibacillus danicus]
MLAVTIQKKLPYFQLDVDFTVQKEIVVLFGPSGAGKTTILNSVAGLIQPDSGTIRLNDTIFFETGQKPLPTRKRKLGYLFQDYALFPHMTVEKNILYGVKKEREAVSSAFVVQLLTVLGIRHLLPKYPHQISGGEKQRVALARALAGKPELLLLDEPLSALDAKTRQQCQDELLELHRLWQIPVLLVTHDEKEAEKLGNRILTINQGKIVDK